MAISVLERLRLGNELAEKMAQTIAAKGMQKITLGLDVVALMEQLGLNQAAPKPDQGGIPETVPNANVIPEVVKAFLNGEYSSSTPDEFIDVLRRIEPYLGTHLNEAQAKAQTEAFINRNGFEI